MHPAAVSPVADHPSVRLLLSLRQAAQHRLVRGVLLLRRESPSLPFGQAERLRGRRARVWRAPTHADSGLVSGYTTYNERTRLRLHNQVS